MTYAQTGKVPSRRCPTDGGVQASVRPRPDRPREIVKPRNAALDNALFDPLNAPFSSRAIVFYIANPDSQRTGLIVEGVWMVGTAQRGTRERLLAAAREPTEEGGYGVASVVAIAKRAGLGAGTLYRHFPSKADLFVELFRAVCEGEVLAMGQAVESGTGGAVERLEVVVGTFAERALRNRRLAWALIAEPVDPLVDAERLAYRARYAQLLAAALREAVASGELPEQDAELTAAALVGGVGEALVGPLSPLADGSAPDELVVDAIRVFARRAVGCSS